MAEGHVIVIGGAEDKVRTRLILSRFIALAGGSDARIAVVSSASSLGPLAGEMYRQLFTELGAASVVALHASTRAQANDDHGARRAGLQDRAHFSTTRGSTSLNIRSTIRLISIVMTAR